MKWLRERLFSSVFNSALTLVAIVAIYYLLSGLVPWIAQGVWQAESIRECREIAQGGLGGCFAVLSERWNQLLFGFSYPSSQYWRPTLAFLLMIVAFAPVLFLQPAAQTADLHAALPVHRLLSRLGRHDPDPAGRAGGRHRRLHGLFQAG